MHDILYWRHHVEKVMVRSFAKYIYIFVGILDNFVSLLIIWFAFYFRAHSMITWNFRG